MVDYRGLPGAFVFAFRRSASHLFRAYAVASAALGVLLSIVLLLALVSWLGTPGPFGQTAFLAVLGVLLLVPIFAPVMVVARRHRRGSPTRRADATLGLAGFAVVVAIWLSLFVSAPDPTIPPGPLAPALVAVDALPRAGWPLPLLLGLVLLAAAIWLTRPEGTAAETGEPDEDEGPPPEATIHAGPDAGERTER